MTESSGTATGCQVQVVTGTSTCLEAAQARELGITLVPLRIAIDGRDLRDQFDISTAEVYRLLRAGKLLTTSSPTPGDYAEAFESSVGPVLCLTEGAILSASNGAARVAAQVASDREVAVVDTGTAAGGLRLLAIAAARLAAGGMCLAALVPRVRELATGVEMAGMLETVEYLGRSGRIPEIAYWGGSLLRVRPVVSIKDGRGRLAALARSPRRGLRALHALALRDAEAHGAGPRGERLHCTVFHADAAELGAELRRRLAESLPAAELSLSEMTPAMGVHTGPGVVGHALYVEPE